MKVTLLGTGSPIPDPNRAGPSTLVTAGGVNLLVDAGRGVCMRLMAAGCPPPAVAGVLLTHLHSDHITDLNDVATSRWILSENAAKLYGFDLDALAPLAAQHGPTVEELRQPLTELPENPNSALIKGTGGSLH